MNKELLDKVISLYTEIGKIDESIKMLEVNKADLLSQLNEYKVVVNNVESNTDLVWEKWVSADEDGDIYVYSETPIKVDGGWWPTDGDYKVITKEEAIALCGRVPKWSDNKPTPVKR